MNKDTSVSNKRSPWIWWAGIWMLVTMAACSANAQMGNHSRNAYDGNALATTCADVPEAERDAGPLAHRDLIESVTEVREERKAKPFWSFLRGAEIAIHAQPGMTKQWLMHVSQCHLGRYAALRSRPSDNGNDPFAVDQPIVTVAETATGFTIALRTSHPDNAPEIVRRSRRLATNTSR